MANENAKNIFGIDLNVDKDYLSGIAANEPVAGKFIVRKWDATEWHSPTREYLGLKDK